MRAVIEDRGCVNEQCPHFGLKGQGNVVLRRLYGKSDTIRLLRCEQCGQEFSERRGTPLFGFRLARAKLVDVVKHLAEGIAVRKTARLTGVSRTTVGRVLNAAGDHAKAVHDQFVRGVAVSELQMDEMWSFIKKRQESSLRGAEPPGVGLSVGSHRRGRRDQAGRLDGPVLQPRPEKR